MKKPTYLALKLSVLSFFLLFLGFWTFLGVGCPIRRVTGMICPGCGMTRAWLAVLRLDISSAFRFHPMFWGVPVFILFALYDFHLIPVRWINIFIMAALGLGIIVCYLLRLTAFLQSTSVI